MLDFVVLSDGRLSVFVKDDYVRHEFLRVSHSLKFPCGQACATFHHIQEMVTCSLFFCLFLPQYELSQESTL